MMANHNYHCSGGENDDENGNETDDDLGCGDIGNLFESHHPTIIKRFEWGSPSRSRINLAAESATDVITTDVTIATGFVEQRDTIELDTRRPIEASSVSRRSYGTKERQETEEEPTTPITTATATATATATTLPPVTPTFPFVVYSALVRCIDDDPGAVVSGHYVWPASLLMCDYLVANHHCSRQSSVERRLGYSENNDDGICKGVPSSGGSNNGHGHGNGNDNDNENDNANHNDNDNRDSNSNNNRNSKDEDDDDDNDAQNVVRSVLELGAGVGIPSIVASQVFGDTLERMVVTDRDPTALERARENHQRSMEDATRRRCGSRRGGSPEPTRIRRLELELVNENTTACGGPPPLCIGESAMNTNTNTNTTAFAFAAAAPPPIRTEFLVLRWGSESDWQRLGECMNTNEAQESQTQTRDQEPPPKNQGFFDLVVGSDLIDCVETVDPLFHTIDRALKSGNSNSDNEYNNDNDNEYNNNHNTHGRSRCLLSQSFAYDSETEDEIDAACDRFRLERRVLADTHLVPTPPKRNGHSTGGRNGATSTMTIQEFRRKA